MNGEGGDGEGKGKVKANGEGDGGGGVGYFYGNVLCTFNLGKCLTNRNALKKYVGLRAQ